MRQVVKKRSSYILLAVVMIVAVLFMIYQIGKNNESPLVTGVVSTGTVKQLVSISGTAEAQQTAELAFPTTGIVNAVSVVEGDVVEAGDVLVTLDNRALQADRQDAIAALTRAIADRDELIAGPSEESRLVTTETVTLKQEALETTTETENKKVENAYLALLSTDLEALPERAEEEAVAPTITGTYTCENEGVYIIKTYSSSANSGYSFSFSGLESGTSVAGTNQPVSLGSCGLYIQFDSNSAYRNTEWEVAVPNKKSSLYVTNLNAYNLAKTQANNAISLAEQDLILAQANAANSNAPARAEALARANASVLQAQARLDRIDSTIEDRVLRAPFPGVITHIDILPGETVTTAPVVTLLAEKAFDVTALIPEIDIGKLLVGQKAEMVFDARTTEVVTGTISFISLKATEIDGVSYYEATIQFDEIPPWLRSGLSADVDIVISETENVLRVPKRFVHQDGDVYTVLTQNNGVVASTTIELLLAGDDGWMAITGVNEGDTIVAP